MGLSCLHALINACMCISRALVCMVGLGSPACELVQVTPDLKTSAMKLACYKGIPLSTSKGPCTVHSIMGGSIK